MILTSRRNSLELVEISSVDKDGLAKVSSCRTGPLGRTVFRSNRLSYPVYNIGLDFLL